DASVPSSADGRADHQRGYFDVKYGLTGAEAAFAETGSVVVRSGPGRPRMASLIPLIHVVLLPEDRIYRSPMHWLTEPESNAAGAANVVYITGPSRTADIEQKLTLGVHGPRELHVILIPA
ncbi:MAG: lactate utilization protein, partial [Chloroflexota bacterium]|nr:lactate utilization protein [Chloroflexota bacterium]